MQDDGFFDAAVAQDYDRDHGGTDAEQVARTVDTLFALAEGGPALEFAIGTGRIALPLAARGCAVSGIELSRAMVAELRRKETGAPLDVSIGDMATTQVEGAFALVFLVFNTIDNLVTQEAQIACFQNAARHLRPGGRFLIETQVPPLQRIPFGETMHAFVCDDTHTGVGIYDVATQAHWSHHVWTREGRTTRLTIPFRYVWPSELDLMARLAGMTPEARWGDWDRSAFTNTSTRHVSVWRKPG